MKKVTFIDYNLTDQEKAVVKDTMPKPEAMYDYSTRLVEMNYKISISFNAEKGINYVSLTGKKARHPNYMKCLVIRHTDIMVALWAHYHILMEQGGDDGWETLAEKQGGSDDW